MFSACYIEEGKTNKRMNTPQYGETLYQDEKRVFSVYFIVRYQNPKKQGKETRIQKVVFRGFYKRSRHQNDEKHGEHRI